MAGSSTGGFTWTPEKSTMAIYATCDIVATKKLDPFADENIEKVLSKLRRYEEFQGVQPEDVKAHLYECKQRFKRVCELVNLPYCMGYLESNHKVWMLPDKYDAHIKVTSLHSASFLTLSRLLLTC
jgi:hypothetical protein